MLNGDDNDITINLLGLNNANYWATLSIRITSGMTYCNGLSELEPSCTCPSDYQRPALPVNYIARIILPSHERLTRTSSTG